MAGIGQGGGGEVVFPIGDSMQSMGKQTSGGPLTQPALKDANQMSAIFNQGQSPLTLGWQQICQKINEAVNVDSNMNKAYSAGENLNALVANKNNQIGDKTFKGFQVSQR